MRKSLVSVGFGLLLLIVGSFVSNLIININKSEPNYNNNSLTSVYIKVVENNSISCDLIDLRTLSPLDTDTIINSVNKTGKAYDIADNSKTPSFPI